MLLQLVLMAQDNVKLTNLINFISNFELVNKKLKQRKHSVIQMQNLILIP